MAYLMIAQRQMEQPELAGYYNVGPDDCDCVTTGQLVNLFCNAWGEGAFWENRGEKNAPHEANFLKLDCSKVKTVFNWQPRWHIDDAICKTVEWTKAWVTQENIEAVMSRQIQDYLEG